MTTPNPTDTAEQEAPERAVDKMRRETGIPTWALETAFELSTLGMLDEETLAGTRVIPDTARIIAARVHRDVAGGEAVCWHCGVVLAYAPNLRCEDCPTECDVEGCSEYGCSPTVDEPTEGAECVKCGHDKGDPRRRGSDEYASFCIYGCGCKCQFSLEDLITTTRNAEQRIFLNNIAAVLDASDVEVFTALVMKAKQSPDLGLATRSALRSETEICAAERMRVWGKAIATVEDALVTTYDYRGNSPMPIDLFKTGLISALQAAANDEAEGEGADHGN